ncbi:MAG: glycerol-3-phosphate 1-O-acyltransferase PlsY [Geobacteraceae bacterium]|nr:glycerol-3-phosphate 1-O-acyltransferase PlsY [Geobacteraceae bacterium]
MVFFVILVAAYLIGGIPSGVILTRIAGAADIRTQGSGNVGATNVYRVAGKRLGVLTLVLDMLKGAVPLVLLNYLMESGALQPAFSEVRVTSAAALLLFLGHCYPVYLCFKGGKGVATALGIFLVLAPVALIPPLLIFIAVLWYWRYVSLASVCAAFSIPFAVLGFGYPWSLVGVTVLIAAWVIYRHRENIQRLRSGTENRFNF